MERRGVAASRFLAFNLDRRKQAEKDACQPA